MIFVKYTQLWVLICVLIASAINTGYICSQYVYDRFEWVFDLDSGGNVHVEGRITLGSPSYSYTSGYTSYGIYHSKRRHATNLAAWEADTKVPIKVVTYERGEGIVYEFRFGGKMKEGFQFFFEYDGVGWAEKIDSDVYSFEYGWDCTCEYIATVLLPKNYVLWGTQYSSPRNVSYYMGRVNVIYGKDDPEKGTVRFGVTYCKEEASQPGTENQEDEAGKDLQDGPVYAPQQKEADSDSDGIPNTEDGCDDLEEDFDGWQDADGCPDYDNDGDGINDGSDRCPNTYGEASDGCSLPPPAESSSIHLGIKLGAVILTVLIIVAVVARAAGKKQKVFRKIETERKKLDEMVSKGVISQKEYGVARKEIEDQLRRLNREG